MMAAYHWVNWYRLRTGEFNSGGTEPSVNINYCKKEEAAP